MSKVIRYRVTGHRNESLSIFTVRLSNLRVETLAGECALASSVPNRVLFGRIEQKPAIGDGTRVVLSSADGVLFYVHVDAINHVSPVLNARYNGTCLSRKKESRVIISIYLFTVYVCFRHFII